MDITEIPLFRLADQRLGWLDRRQQVLAQNIANADTPGYQPADLAPFASSIAAAGDTAAAPGELALTDPAHLPGTLDRGMRGAGAQPTLRAPDGNAVSLQDQLTKVADVETNQAMVSELYRKYLGMFREALGKA
jgi:flagellar basal-body rod protein FlgB